MLERDIATAKGVWLLGYPIFQICWPSKFPLQPIYYNNMSNIIIGSVMIQKPITKSSIREISLIFSLANMPWIHPRNNAELHKDWSWTSKNPVYESLGIFSVFQFGPNLPCLITLCVPKSYLSVNFKYYFVELFIQISSTTLLNFSSKFQVLLCWTFPAFLAFYRVLSNQI